MRKEYIMPLLVAILSPLVWAAPVQINAPVLENNLSRQGSRLVTWDTPRSAWMPECAVPPKIDGALDEACWKDAAVLTGFVTGDSRKQSYNDYAFLCYDSANLYIACRYEEPNPAQISAAVTQDGAEPIWKDDCVELRIQVDSSKMFVSNYPGKPTWAQMIANTRGARFSQLVVERRPGSLRFAPITWNTEWQAAGSVGTNAFFIEIAIPWSKLQLEPKAGGMFRMNVGRNKPDKPESWNKNGYNDPNMFGYVYFGRNDGEGGVEIRDSEVVCAGNDWSAAVNAVAGGSKTWPLILKCGFRKDGKVADWRESKPVSAGRQPVTLRVPLTVKEDGKQEMEVEVAVADGATIAKGRVSAVKSPFLERFFLFRHELAEGDTFLRGYYRLAALPLDTKLAANFELLDDKKAPVATAASEPLTRIEGQFEVAVPPLQPGAYTFRLQIKDDAGKALVNIERVVKVNKVTPMEQKQFTVHVDEPACRELVEPTCRELVESTGVARTQWPITFGAPFAENTLAVEDVATHTRVLDASGKEIPCQSRVTATWSETKRFARWVLFDVQADLAAGKGADFTVEFGKAVKRAAAAGKPLVTTDEKSGDLLVDTGVMKMRIQKQKPSFFGAIEVAGAKVTSPVADGELYLKLGNPVLRGDLLPNALEYDRDRSVKTLIAQATTNSESMIEIEQNGPLRAVIKAAGWFTTKAGEKNFKYILRLYVFKDKAMIQGFHTLIVTEPEQFVESMGLRIQGLTPGTIIWGRDAMAAVARSFKGPVSKLALYQLSAEYFRVVEENPAPDSKETFAIQVGGGRRSPGWLDIAGGGQTMFAGIKDFWQEYPKEISVDKNGLVDLAFVSARGFEHLDLRSVPFANSEQTAGDSEGIAKTTRFVLDFHAADSEPAATLSRANADLSDLAIWIDPQWMQEADPLWQPVTKCALDSEDARKRAYANLVDMRVADQPGRPDVVSGLYRYGILNYGDRMHNAVWRGWFNNEDYYLPFTEWVAYLATGNRPLFDSVTAFSRHLMDVDTLNYTARKNPGTLGLQSRHRRLHWGHPGIVTHTYLDQSLIYFYLLGYERGADHAKLVQWGQRVWNWWPGEGWWDPEKHPTGAVARDYGANMRLCLDAYQHCWDPALMVRTYEFWARYKEGFLPSGEHIAGYFNLDRPLEVYARYTRDPEALTLLTRSSAFPILSAELGKPEKLRRQLTSVDVVLAAGINRLPVPDWFLYYAREDTDRLLVVSDLAGAEQLARQAVKIEPLPVPLKINSDQELVFRKAAGKEQNFRFLIQGGLKTDYVAVKAAITGPDGKTIEPANRRDTETAYLQNELAFQVPREAKPGIYRLKLSGVKGYMRFWMTEGPEKHVYAVDPKELALGYFFGQKFWFYVPEDCERFEIAGRPANRTDLFGYAIYDPEGRMAGGTNWFFNNARDDATARKVEVEAPPEKRGKWWSLAYKCTKDIIFTWPANLPPYITDGPEHGFIPESHRKK